MMRNKKNMLMMVRKVSAYLFALLIVLVPTLTFAISLGGVNGNGPSGSMPTLLDPLDKNGTGSTTFVALVPRVMDALIQVGAVVIALAFIYAGFKYVTALGDEKAIGEAHKIFKYTVIGAAVLLGSSVLAQAIKGTIDALQAQTK